MAVALEERVDNVEASVSTLEYALLQYMTSNSRMIARINQAEEQLHKEMREFKDEMREFKNEMREFKKESERDRKEMNKRWGELTRKWGTVVEDIVFPNLPNVIAKYFEIHVLDFWGLRVRKRSIRNPAREREFDTIAVSDEYLFINETKSTPKPEYASEFRDSLKEIPDFFPTECAGKKLIPIFSSFSIPRDVLRFLSKSGIYAMELTGEMMDIVNFGEVER